MKKKFFYGVLAAALVVLNVFAFSSYAEKPGAGGIPGDPDMGCYQNFSFCKDRYRQTCTRMKQPQKCQVFYCTDCLKHEDPSWPWMNADYTLLPEFDLP
ncbi:MAG: hypothetical protein J6W98_05230 [Bacteroidales bacterium]|nr:hypothetical protein [Bacteroidales bacterium]